jgi:hypothetical protein
MKNVLSIRVTKANLDHHLWNNHGVWWIHYTVLLDGVRQRRVRHSLATRDRDEARDLRDILLAEVHETGVVLDAPRPCSSGSALVPHSLTGTASNRGLTS